MTRIEPTLNKESLGLIIGCGSVGKKHASLMSNRYKEIIIVDPNASVEEWAKANIHCNFDFFASLNDLDLELLSTKFNITAVIATWGPLHYENFMQLADAGVRKIVCEKPLADSVERAAEIYRVSKELKIRLVVGIPRRHNIFAGHIQKLLHKYCGGEAQLISVTGGAQCMATTGIHWLDLAIQVFEHFPLSVDAKISDSKINPRDKTLGFWEGTSAWEFPNEKRFVMSFTNSSRVGSKVDFYAKSGVLTLEPSGEISIKRIELTKEEVELPVTRTKAPLNYPLQEDDSFDYSVNPFAVQLEVADGEQELFYPLGDAVRVLDALIGAFESSMTSKTQLLPLVENSDAFKRRWQIS